MYVCVCNAVTEGQVRQKLDAESVCGSCDDCLEDYLAEAFMFASPGLRAVAAD